MDGDDTLNGGDQADILDAGAGNDMVISGGDDMVDAGEGAGSVILGEGSDMIDAGAGNDRVLARAGDDIIDAGTGDDTVVDGAGNDVLSGGAGSDTFHFAKDSGRDTILDFVSAKTNATTHDVIEISRSIFANYEEMMADNALDNGDAGAVIDLGGNSFATLANVKAETLAIDDFRFV